MYATAKSSVTSWWILAMMSLFLWYRNEKYDRALSAFIFTLGLIQLIEYGIHSGADQQQSGQALFITLWLQCLVLAIGVFLFTNRNETEITTTKTVVGVIAGWNLFLFAIIFVIALMYILMSNSSFTSQINTAGHLEWHRNDASLLGFSGYLYIVGIFLPLILIFGYYLWADITIAILILYGILSAAYVVANYSISSFNSVWCYLSVGFAFLSWFLGVIPSHEIATVNMTVL